MTDQEKQFFIRQVCALTAANRTRCLWFVNEDFSPKTIEAAQRALSYIEKYGDRAAYEESSRLKQWLLHHSNVMSAG